MNDAVMRAILMIAGGSCVGSEVWCAYDFMWAKYQEWYYLVVGSIVLTSLAAMLPLAAEYAHRQGMGALKWGAWLGVPVALAFVLTVSVQRTGGAADTDEAGRKQIAEAIKIAKDEQSE